MTPTITCIYEANTLTLAINGQQRNYPNDKAGKREAILDGLAAIEPIRVAGDEYLPSNAALQVVAAVLYPEGIETEAAYQTVCQVTAKACAHIGYGEEVELGPPIVPFANRGAYRKRVPPVDAQMVIDELALAGTSSTYPRQEVTCTIIWNKAGLAVYGNHWSQLTPAQQTLIQSQVDEIAAQSGWAKDDGTTNGTYTKPLPIDEGAARSRLAQLLHQENGRPVLVSSVIYQVQVGAYGRGFYTNDLAPTLQTLITETLQTHGYHLTLEDGEYRPLPVSLESEDDVGIAKKLAAITPVVTELGQALLLRDVLDTLGVDSISEWQAEQLVENGRVSQALRQLGYQTELTWCQPLRQAQGRPSHFQPKLEKHEAQQVILKEVRVKNDPTRKLSLAKGLAVLTPALAIDDVDDTLVYLEMIGAK